jgi:hypothetical protein
MSSSIDRRQFIAALPALALAPSVLAQAPAKFRVNGLSQITLTVSDVARSLDFYQGLFGMGFGASNMVAPALLTAVVLGLGRFGWLLVGLTFVAVGALTPVAVRWAQRSRPVVRDAQILPASSAYFSGYFGRPLASRTAAAR